LCGSKNIKKRYNIDRYIFLKCKKCGVVFLDHDFSGNDIFNIYNDGKYLSSNYKYNYAKENNDANLNYFSNIEQKIKQAKDKYIEIMDLISYQDSVGAKKNFLDIGSAAGIFLSEVKLHNFNAYGIEISKEGAIFSREKFGVNVIAKDVLDLDDAYNDYFDFVSMFHVLEHLPDPKSHLKKIFHIMKKDAFLIVEVPNIKSVDSLFFKYLIRILQPPHHLFAFDYNNIEWLLKETGFEIIEKRVYFSNVVGMILKKILLLIGQKNISIPRYNLSTNRKNVLGYKKNNFKIFIKRILNKIFPGSVMIIICRK
jgi:2-polyprenyl-3-methyl-5-hydroxy-6-metoxy-1,4-benzoquinol methylase